MTALRLLVVLAGGFACGCSALTPFATMPANAPKGVVDPRPRVAICVNPLKTSPEQAQQAAQAQCLGNTVAEQVTGNDYWLDVCPLAVPARITFVCTPKK
ncbi:MAG TPA: hypothetical protein VGR70_13145 [Stellaceae bacterium]|nr:hypothetical protein [Stellaceae bacterium]